MWLLFILISYYLKLLFLFINNNVAPASATLITGVIITLGINYWQIQVGKANREQDLKINQENNQEEILQKYLEEMEKLLLINNLDNGNNNNPARNIARFKTLTVLRRLTFKPQFHKAIILKFLYDTELIKIQSDENKSSKLSLVSCDFQKANLKGAYLSRANLSEANLRRANFKGAYLEGADLYEADLRGANLKGAYFSGADLRGADFSGADLREANLSEANLSGADLRGADFEGADFSEAKLRGADLEGADLHGINLLAADLEAAYFDETKSLDIKKLKSAKNWEKAIYTQALWGLDSHKWIPIDKEANEAKIQEIRDSTEGYVKF